MDDSDSPMGDPVPPCSSGRAATAVTAARPAHVQQQAAQQQQQPCNRVVHIKKLTASDAFTTNEIKLLRFEARRFIGELRPRQTVPLVGGRAAASWE